MTKNNEETKTQITTLVEKLLSCDNAKHLLSNFTDMYVAYNQSQIANCQDERASKSGTFLFLTDFLGGLNSLKK